MEGVVTINHIVHECYWVICSLAGRVMPSPVLSVFFAIEMTYWDDLLNTAGGMSVH